MNEPTEIPKAQNDIRENYQEMKNEVFNKVNLNKLPKFEIEDLSVYIYKEKISNILAINYNKSTNYYKKI